MDRFFVLFLTITLISIQALAYPLIPDLEITPSSVCNVRNPDFKEYRYREQIPYCGRNVSTSLKAYIYSLYQIPKKCRGNYTIDHFIPLSIGGDNSLENLWPEHKNVKAERPNLEWDIYQKLKNGVITQKKAINIIYVEKTSFGQPFLSDDCM